MSVCAPCVYIACVCGLASECVCYSVCVCTDLHVDFEYPIGCLLQRLRDGAKHERKGRGVQIKERSDDLLTDTTNVSTLRFRCGL